MYDEKRAIWSHQIKKNLLVSERFNIIEETSSSGLSFACWLPEDAGRVDDVAEEDGWGDVAEQAEDDELDTQSESFLFFVHSSEKKLKKFFMLAL